MIKGAVLKILVFYKKHISRGESCRYVPSCSEYMYEAIGRYGVVKGAGMGLWRLIRCNPWSKGGIDLVK